MEANEVLQNKLKPADWDEKYWKPNNLYFHKTEPHPMLVKYHDNLVAGKQRIFIPLCGKSLDMVWLAEKGHEVVGIEYSEFAIKSFFKENNIDYTVTNKSVFEIYKATVLNILIYKGDYFKIDKQVVGEFDAAWDRGSFVAIHPDQRIQYVNLMLSVLKENARILLISCFYDYTKYAGPPFPASKEVLEDHFDSSFIVNFLETFSSYEIPEWNIPQFNIIAYFLE